MQSKRGDEIKGGLTGFLVTCDMKNEKRCIREVFNVLNDYTEKVYAHLDFDTLLAKQNVETKPESDSKKNQKPSTSHQHDDLEEELATLRN